MAQIKPKIAHLKNGREVTLRAGAEEDAPQLLATISTYISENSGMVWEPDEYKKTDVEMREWIRGMRENPIEVLILAIFDGKIVGNIDFHAGNRRRIAHVGEFGMGMLPEFRNKGLGSLLLESMIEWAKQTAQLEKINLHVIDSNAQAIGLYRKFGFKEEGRRPRQFKYSDGNYADDVLMSKLIK